MDHEKVHARAIAEFDLIWNSARKGRESAISDRRFATVEGAQWEGALEEQYENRVKIEINKIEQSITRIISEWRNNRIDVDFVTTDGSEDDGLADVCDGLYRADEKSSGALEAYDNAFEEGLTGGMGAWRLTTEYVDEYDDENDYQRIIIDPIFEADQSVFFDLDSKRQDKKDSKRCFVIEGITRESYIDEYGDDPVSWPKESATTLFDWATTDVIYVAEYYVVETVDHSIHVYKSIDGKEERFDGELFEEDEAKRKELLATGYKKLREKKVKRTQIRKYILSGGGVIGPKDGELIPGKHIPIVPFFGKRNYVDNIERFKGHVRPAKDAQRLKNMQVSKAAEFAASSTVSIPIFTPEQMAGGRAAEWASANVKNNPFLLVNATTGANGEPIPAVPLAYTKTAEVPQTMALLLQLVEQDIQDLLGSQKAGEELEANISGKAVELVQNRLDQQNFLYFDNMKKSFQRAGEIWLSMAKEIYVEDERTMKTIGRQGEKSSIKLGDKILSKSGEVISEGDLSRASFSVEADVGPSSSSKKSSVVRAALGLMQVTQDPATIEVLGALVLQNMEGEGLSEIKEWVRKKLLKLGIGKPTDDDLKAAQDAEQNKPTDAQELFLLSEAEKNEAQIGKLEADKEKVIADTAKIDAQTIETLASVDRDERQSATVAANELSEDAHRQVTQPDNGVNNSQPPGFEG